MLASKINSKVFFVFYPVIALICLLVSIQGNSQDIHFAQISETPLQINPALTGEYNGFYRGILNYRNQWPALGKSFNTVMGSFDMPFERKKKKGSYIGAGACFFSDKGGDSRFGTTQAKLSVASIVPASANGRFSAGLQLGLVQHSLNITNIQWPNQYDGFSYDSGIDPNEQLNKTSFSFFDIVAGINYFTSKTTSSFTGGNNIYKFNIGASFSHASFPLQKFYTGSKEKQYARILLHSSMRYDIKGTKLGIVPSLMFMMQGPATELYLGGLLRYKMNEGTKVTNFYAESAISAGIFYRYKDAISPQVYLEFSDYAIGLSYDFNASTYGEVQKSAGGFELSFRYANMRGAARKKSGI